MVRSWPYAMWEQQENGLLSLGVVSSSSDYLLMDLKLGQNTEDQAIILQRGNPVTTVIQMRIKAAGTPLAYQC